MTDKQIKPITAALQGWRHWVGNDMLTQLGVPDVEESKGRGARFQARLAVADAKALEVMQEFFEIGPYAPQQSLWGSGLKLFVSHVTAALGDLMLLTEALKPYGIAPFLAHEAITPMKRWHDVLLDALGSMDALLSFHSNGFNQSDWCGQEVGFALGRSIPVVPVMARELPAGFLGAVQAIKWKAESNNRCVEAVLGSLLAHDGIGARMSEPIARNLKFAGSWDSASTQIALLERCAVLSPAAARNVELALLLNDQVRGNDAAELLLLEAA